MFVSLLSNFYFQGINHLVASKSYYELLGVPPNADVQTLKKAFYRLSKSLHPDTTLLPVKDAANKFCQVCEAYELLSDPIRREWYDQSLKESNFISEVVINEFDLDVRSTMKTIDNIDNRRALSGGELFPLLLLCLTILISLLLAIGFAVLDGRELQISPSWLHTNQSFIKDSLHPIQNVDFTPSENTSEPAFFETT